jgi:hypothetical protein
VVHPVLYAWNPLVRAASLAFAACLVAPLIGASPVLAVSLPEACERFESKLKQAQASNDPAQVQKVYSQGSKRIASRFNGATCPGIKAP